MGVKCGSRSPLRLHPGALKVGIGGFGGERGGREGGERGGESED